MRARRWLRGLVGLAITVILLAGLPANCEEIRKVKVKVSPPYPDLAKRMHLTGAVKVEVTVAPNGEVKAMKVIGGHPVLVDSTINTIRKWRFEPRPSESIEMVQVNFVPPE